MDSIFTPRINEALANYGNVYCPHCGDFLFWDYISEHLIDKHAIPPNIILSIN